MKYTGAIVFVAFLLAFAATSYATSSTWAKINKKDKILHSERIYEYLSPRGFHKDVQFPKLGQTNEFNITVIQAIDYSRNPFASDATLIAGGPGFKYATVAFRSTNDHGLDFQLVIYGK